VRAATDRSETPVVSFLRRPELPGLELVRYPSLTRGWRGIPEAYTWFTMIAWLEGDVEVHSRGVRAPCEPASVTVGEPGEPYALRPRSAMRGEFRVIRVDTPLLDTIVEEVGLRPGASPFPRAPLRHEHHARRFAQCYEAIATGERLAVEQRLATFVAGLLGAGGDASEAAPPGAHGGIERARELLHATFHTQVPLDELAQAAGMDRFRFLRAFAQQLGMTPHAAYQMQLRVARARRLIAANVPLAEVALAVGYSEQSALQRPFKRLVGVTPGAYARSVRA
jgi:AraC-like DNA-binding protein